MSYSWRLLLLLLLCVRQETELSIAVRRFVYQKDMSEYCRRRVIPSVFLGRQVVEANSQILHFSRMELPYSCFISIRNIILVIQLMSDKSLVQSCKESGSQLAVYELGETFGGYWGPLPMHVMKQEPREGVSFYTAKTTQTPSTTDFGSVEESDVESEEPVSEVPKEAAPPGGSSRGAGDFLSVELPIVNVSARLLPGSMRTDSPFNVDESFDIVYDVTPGVGMQYQSSVLPLVQFSIDNVVGGAQRGGGVRWSPRFRVDYDSITPDSRLNFLLGSTTSKRTQHGYNYNVNRRLNFKKNKHLFSAKETPLHKKQHSTIRRAQYTMQHYNIFTRHYDFIQPPQSEEKVEPAPNSWDVIEDILKNLSKTKDVTTHRPTKNDSNLLHRISDMEHNISAYLSPNLSMYKNVPTSSSQLITRYSTGTITWRLPSASYGSNIQELEQLEVTKNNTNKGDVLLNDVIESTTSTNAPEYTREEPIGTHALTLDIDNIILKEANVSIVDVASEISTNIATGASDATTTKGSELLTGSLVDHESWENVVQSAPVMAVMLNQSAPRDTGAAASAHAYQSTTTTRLVNVRKKRYVYAIPIEDARPHKLPTVKEQYAPTTPAYKISDAQEFAELVELQDDELHGRVALRYLHQFVGPVLFNICDYNEATARHVYLFNSSRLVLAINNFTMERMTVVVTPARALAGGAARCAGARLECQVSGARVCIDSLSACDGIPNCGSYDVYDEDRLMCGAAVGLQHNVCLAAFTFLAVLLTILYSVHYWLKRCVPKVSDAFFIYTDAAENVLYLDSIMRAPYEGDEGKSYYRSNLFQEEMHPNENQNQGSKNLFKRFFKICFNFTCCKRKEVVLREDVIGEFYKGIPDSQRMYSFAEVEINKMTRKNWTDAGVQTGPSLEMKIRSKDSVYNFHTNIRHDNEKAGTSKDTLKFRDRSSPEPQLLENSYDEISMLKFFRKARSASLVSNDLSRACKVSSPPKNVAQIPEEEELRCLDLDRSEQSMLPPPGQVVATGDIHTAKAEHVRKRLRFDEETTTIPSTTVREVVAESEKRDDSPQRRSIVLGAAGRTHRSQDLDAIEECEEQRGSREYKSYFWGGGKNKTKKPKKKSQVSLH